mmetsp:Transcript_118920/g.236991  ORF Transcript_118920/g.236991 Transcript_118920/m.236991 type:complete len:249 (+) Transcript_118920:48-794(+)
MRSSTELKTMTPPGLPGAPPKRHHEWSPINRMLASRQRSSKSASPVPPMPVSSCREPVPPLLRSSPCPPLQTSVGTQTASWPALAAEVAAADRKRAKALQQSVASLQAALREHEENARTMVICADQAAEQLKRTYAAEMLAVHTSCAKKAAAHEEDKQKLLETSRLWQEDRQRWQKERTELRAQAEHADAMRQELHRRNQNIDDLRKECRDLQKSSNELMHERDALLERLEVEQAHMNERIARLEKRC